MSCFLSKDKAFLVSTLQTLRNEEILTWSLISAGTRPSSSSRIAHHEIPLSFLWQASGRLCPGRSSRQALSQGHRMDIWLPSASFPFPMSRFHRHQLLPISLNSALLPSYWVLCVDSNLLCHNQGSVPGHRRQPNTGLTVWVPILRYPTPKYISLYILPSFM